jgi:ABC-type uncharacterized transport system fused permease/ATPase subunit
MEILKGQSLLVIGHSGCGKSSLLRAIAGELSHFMLLWPASCGSPQRKSVQNNRC